MRQKTRNIAQSSRSSTKEPLAEGLQFTVPTDSKGRRMWRRLSDDQIVSLAKKVLAENKIIRKKELETNDHGLYQVLYRRKLFDEIGFEEKQRSWEGIIDEEILEFARKLMDEKGISGRNELQKVDLGLYKLLKKRMISSKIGFEKKRGKRRFWKDMCDEEIVDYARKMMKEKKMPGRVELKNADSGLYEVLRKRELFDQVGFEEKLRSWKDISDEELVEFAKKFVKKRRIGGKHELQKEDGGLYKVLIERKLVDEIGFEEKRRPWKDMSDEEILEYAMRVMGGNGIGSRKELQDVDCGSYEALRKRGLLDRAFVHIDQKKNDQARDAVIDALEAFAANDNDSAEDDVA